MSILFTISKTLNTIIFIIISGFHFYWAFGGKFGSKAVVPEISSKLVFKPSVLATIVVAFVMLIGAWLLWKPHINSYAKILIYGNLAIGIIMLIRAIGDFRYVGFFKKVKGTLFAQNDTLYYSPLCVLISLDAFYIYSNIR